MAQCHPGLAGVGMQEHAGGFSLHHSVDKRSLSTSQSRDVCPKQSPLTAFMPYKQTSNRQKISQMLLCIALLEIEDFEDFLPISTVEKEGFKRLINLIDPRYVLPGRKHEIVFLKV